MADTDIQTYLRAQGLVVPSRHPRIEKDLEKSLGPDAYDNYCAVSEGVARGRFPISHLYDCMKTIEQAHLLFSHQSHLAVCAYGWLLARVKQRGKKIASVADLGCATGLLANFIAEDCPEINVTGFDRHTRFIGWARERFQRPNLRFEMWDYAAEAKNGPKFDMLVTSLGIDFPAHHLPVGEGIERIRDRECYEFILAGAQREFNGWAKIAKPETTLAAILRIPDVATFVAVADAAGKAGWSIQLDACRSLTLKGETFSGLMFSFGEPVQLDESDLVSYWLTRDLLETPLRDAAAFAVFQQLKKPEVIAHEQEEYPDGNVMNSSVCVSGPFLIRFTEATTGFARLEVFPLHKRSEVEPKLSWHWE
jgi:SAM-dependent methyltransferase